MKILLKCSARSSAVLAALAAFSSVHAATLYWDTNGSTAGLGGTGSWSNTGVNWSTDTGGTLATAWANANRDTADFRGTGGAVTVDEGGVAADSLLFGAGGYALSGGVITLGRTAGTGNYTMVNYSAGASAVTVSSNLLLNDNYTAAARTYTFTNASGQSLALNGNITVDFSSAPTGNTTLTFTTGTSASSTTIGGQILKGTNGGTLLFNFGTGGSSQSNANSTNGTFYLNGDNSAVTANSTIHGGTVIISHGSALGTGTIAFGTSGSRGDMKLLTSGAITVSNALNMSGASTSQTYLGGNTAHDSTFSGSFNMNAFASTPDPILTAAAGGRVNFTGVLSASAAIPRGIVKKGAGIVALSGANTYKGYTKVDEGTLLLMNTTGSATGDGSQLAVGEAGVIVASGAKLGGTGTSSVKVSASASDSVFTPGDMTKAGVSSIGTLKLTGGLVAASGATFNYDLNGSSIDAIDFGAGAVSLAGTATFNFTSLGSVLTGTDYSLFVGTGDWSSISSTFVFNGPAGYVVNTYAFDAANHILTVQFAASSVPEPSTFAFLAGAAVLAAVTCRRPRRTAA